MKKNQNGITLIALVITIIVLLILAGVSIAMLTGENGILTKATNAKNESAEAEVVEAVKLGVAEIQADKLDTVSTNKGTTGVLSAKEIAKAAIRNNSSISETTVKEDNSNANSTTEISTAAANIYLTLNKVDYVVTYTPAKEASGDTAATPATITATVVTPTK